MREREVGDTSLYKMGAEAMQVFQARPFPWAQPKPIVLRKENFHPQGIQFIYLFCRKY